MKNKRLTARRLSKTKKTSKNYIKYLVGVALLLLVIIIISFMTTRHWDGKSRLEIVKVEKNGEVVVEILDPSTSSISLIKLPKDTEVMASHQLGIWKLGSIWKLGQDQKFGGEFLRSTVIKSFKFPVEEWEGEGSGSFTFWDKVEIFAFNLSVKENQKITIDLADSDYLVRSKLSDGSIGYKISDKMPIFISTLFADPALFNKDINLVINNATSSDNVASSVAKVIEVLGIKVTSINKLSENNDDCIISGTNNTAMKKLSKIFNCQIVSKGSQNNFDVEVNLGKAFKSRF